MTTRAAINDFISHKTLAVVGASRDGKKFGNAVFKALRLKGYRMYPVNPNTDVIEGERCYPNLKALPEKVDGVIIVVPPNKAEQIVQEVAAEQIPRVWMQQGSESKAAVRYCEEHGIDVIAGQCILMFAEPLHTFDKMHRWVKKMTGMLPQ